MNSALHQLKSATGAFLSPAMDLSGISEAGFSLNKLFREAVAFDEMKPGCQANIPTNAGVAIGPRWAASCLVDMMRTRKFLLGIRDAIDVRLVMNPGKPVTVMYAGTGPFATLLTPLITIFRPAQLQMVLIDINRESIHYLQKLILQFGMEDYLINVVEADAVTWSIPDNHQPDIIICETMNNALQKEPQVSIAANLLSQCTRNPFFIPELIKVEACLIGDTSKNPEAIICLKTLIELDAETAACIKNNPEDIPALSPGIIVTIPGLPDSLYNQLVLCTAIRIFGQHSLGFNESGLTVPHIVRMTASIKKYPVHFLFQYCIDSNPGFRVTEISDY